MLMLANIKVANTNVYKLQNIQYTEVYKCGKKWGISTFF